MLQFVLISHSYVFQIVGFVLNTLLFNELLKNMFSDQVSGIDCVIGTEVASVTYSIKNGQAIFQSV